MNGRTDPNEPVSNQAKFYGACSITLRSVYLNQISVKGEHVDTGEGADQIGVEWLREELTRELKTRVPNYDAYQSPYIPPPPEVTTMEGILEDHVNALAQWFADGRPAIPPLGPTSQGQGG